MYPRNTQNTRKEIHVCAIPRRLEIQQEITEKTEDRSNLCSLRCLLFKSPSVARSCRTIKLSDRSPDTSKPETPRHNPKAQPGSLQRLVRHQIASVKNFRSDSLQKRRAGQYARNISDVPTKHTKTNPQRPGECASSPKPTGGN